MTDAAVRLWIVVPAYNEADRLAVGTFTAFLAAQPAVGIIFVDDGSTDGTRAVLERVGEAGRVRVIGLDRNVGKGEAVRQGLRAAIATGGDVVGYLDADLAAPLETMVALAHTLRSDPALALVLGSRVKLLGWSIHRSEARHYLGRVFATAASLVLALPVYDTQCGAKVLRTSPALEAALAEPFLSRWLFDVELIARLRDQFGPEALREEPVAAWHDAGGSRLRFADFLRAPWELLRIRRKYPPRGPERSAGGGGAAPAPG